MRTVHKYTLEVGDSFEVDMPQGAELLHVDMQHGQPRLWALVDPTQPLVARKFRLAGTGHPIIEEVVRYVGTFQMNSGTLVFHVFEVLVS